MPRTRPATVADVARSILSTGFGSGAGVGHAPDRPPTARLPPGDAGTSASPTLAASAGPTLTAFQVEGLRRVRDILERRGGVILADSVGLGKTYIALGVVRDALDRGGTVVAAVPASLRGFWRRALEGVAGRSSGGWRLVSHTQLARGGVGDGGRAGRVARPCGPEADSAMYPGLVVVDEAHRFRNPGTLRYAGLSRLVGPGTGVLLITATPVNNAPTDLLSLLRLFAHDDGFRDLGVASLAGAFDVDGAPRQLERVVRAAVVRRTRRMVRDRFPASTLPFPRRAPPRIVTYRDALLPAGVAAIESLELAAYDDAGDTGHGAADRSARALLRLSLLKRLDSSRAAFRASLLRLRHLCRVAADAADAGLVLDAGGLRRSRETGDGDPLQLVMTTLVARAPPPHLDLADLRRRLRRDLRIVEGLIRRDCPPRSGRPASDPKLTSLLETLGTIGTEKALVFTEYRDTAAALWHALTRGSGALARLRVGRVDGGGAWLGRHSAGRGMVIARFAPRSNGRPPPPDREQVDVLIATDVLAAGLNLQDARHVISYDLPWNPVRLLQRIGRIDRLGSPHDEVVPHLFVPTHDLEAVLRLNRTVRSKLGGIADTVGTEGVDPLIHMLARADPAGMGAAVARRLERIAESEHDPMETLRTLWIRHRAHHARTHRETVDDSGAGECARTAVSANTDGPVVAAVATRIATLRVAPSHPAATLAWVLAAEPDWILEIDRAGAVREAGPAAVAALRTALTQSQADSGRGHGPGPRPLPGRMTIGEATRAAVDFLARCSAAARAPAPLAPRSTASRMARRIQEAMAAAGSAVDPKLVEAADRALAQLARRSTPTPPAPSPLQDDPAEFDSDAVARDPHAALEALLARAEVCGPDAFTPPAGTSVPQRARITAALAVATTPRPVDASRKHD